MSAFLETYDLPDSKLTSRNSLFGALIPVACQSWITSTGRVMPLWVCLEENYETIRIRIRHIVSSEDRYECGILRKEFVCSAAVGGRQTAFKLIYHPLRCRWEMLVA